MKGVFPLVGSLGLSIPLSPLPSKLGRQSCWVACLLVCVSGYAFSSLEGKRKWGEDAERSIRLTRAFCYTIISVLQLLSLSGYHQISTPIRTCTMYKESFNFLFIYRLYGCPGEALVSLPPFSQIILKYFKKIR